MISPGTCGKVSAEGIDPHFSWGVIPRKDLPIANAC
jgi:hypothetical protein